jgi:hypothetical protein
MFALKGAKYFPTSHARLCARAAPNVCNSCYRRSLFANSLLVRDDPESIALHCIVGQIQRGTCFIKWVLDSLSMGQRPIVCMW